MEGFSLEDLTAPLKAHRGFIAIMTIIVTVLAMLYGYFRVPTTWESETSIVFEASQGGDLNVLRQLSGIRALGTSGNRGEFLEVLLQSRSVRGRAVDAMNLVERLNLASRRAAIGLISQAYETRIPVSQVLVLKTTWEDEPLARIDAETTEPSEMAAELARELIASLEEEVSRNDYTEAARRRALLEEQLEMATRELIEAENELVRYATSEGLVNPSGQTGAAVEELERLQQREAELETELQGARARRAAAEERLSTQEKMDVSSMSESRNPSIDSLRQQILNLRREITEQTEVQGKSEQHPDVASKISELESAEEQLAELTDEDMEVVRRGLSIDPSYSTLVSEALGYSQQISEITAKMATIRDQKREALSVIREFPARSTEYLRLQREVDIKGEVVAGLTESYESARLAEAGSTASFSVIDEPLPPGGPSGPSLKKVGAVAFAASLLFSMVLAYWRDAGRRPVTEEPPADEQVG